MAIHEIPTPPATPQATQAEIEEWLVSYIAELRGMKKEKISRTAVLSKYGLDSASAVTLSGDLMDWLKCDIDPTLLYEHPTIEQAAAHILAMGRTVTND
ncbi:acyl carrier protein [Achromobacter sp. Marseille-Q0513]|uniref:acyl carrier protein n=1 Tax=Achromobacter sp. Marseille-Q0513 TaxID=2829161 RepID=UPI001B904E6B|nr:acyl carrier protein [Achromobacter sp. Marseille-Q0513]MBR8651860.1 acyl carrier protein [Achromobacter sp. Marseille-Q0513]